MAGQRTTFGKLQRERAKKAKAAAKRERRQGRGGEEGLEEGETSEVETVVDDRPTQSPADVLENLETVHQRFDAGMISYEQFEEQKADLLSQLQID